MCYAYKGGRMEVVDNNQYTYNYTKSEVEGETLKIIKPNHTKMIFHHSTDGLDVRLISKNKQPSVFSFDQNSLLFTSMEEILGEDKNVYFLDTSLEGKLLLISKRKQEIVLTMLSISKDEENQYFMTLNRNAFAPLFTTFKEKQRKEMQLTSKKVKVKLF